ncbi:hypothetical protein L204_100696 [Cryptococcus depauperatus]|nr:hypothetical protein L204_01372 [Cryptococcus depauperatus CBS 7855]
MADKILSESEVEATILKLKNADTDKKVDVIQFFGLQLEGARELPESSIDPFLLLLPSLLRTSHSLLVSSVLSLLPEYLPLVSNKPSHHLRLTLLQVLPALMEKLNDAKERVHSAAGNVVLILGQLSWKIDPPISTSLNSSGGTKSLAHSTSIKASKPTETLPQIWERALKDALASKPWRPKVEVMKVLVRLRENIGAKMGLKAWLGVLVECLEDGDGNVRDQARETVIAILSPPSTPPAARSELKKLLIARSVRKTIADNIISRIFNAENSEGLTPAASNSDRLGAGTASVNESRSGTATPALSQADDVEIVYIASAHDLEREFSALLPHFEGKETEQNWLPRERAIARIRGMLKGGSHNKYKEGFISGLKSGGIEGVGKTVLSLRTTVAQQSCSLLKELPEYLGSRFDPFVEHLLPILGKMAGFTKKLIADRSQAVVIAMITHTTCHPRIYIHHIASGVSDKNIQMRHYCTQHLKTFLDVHGKKLKTQIDSTVGLGELLEGAVKKALVDTNPGVRDVARASFWSYSAIFPQKAQLIMDKLDSAARKNLEKANPADASSNTTASSAKPPIKSGLSAMLAERRKAARDAAGRKAGIEGSSPRVVSEPAFGSPEKNSQGLPRSNSSTSITSTSSLPAANKTSTLPSRSVTSPDNRTTSGLIGSSTPTHTAKLRSSLNRDSQDLSPSKRSQSNSLGLSRSPSHGNMSPGQKDSPLRQSSTVPHGRIDGQSAALPESRDELQKTWNGSSSEHDPLPEGVANIEETHAISSSTFSSSSAHAISPSTPGRQLASFPTSAEPPIDDFAFKTPLNHVSRKVWEDSPRPEAVTPLMIDKLKERKHERSWWVKRQELLDRASPFKSPAPLPISAIQADWNGLSSGSPTLRNLQKLALFSSSHPIRQQPEESQEDDWREWNEERTFWENEGLAEKFLDDLLTFLRPEKDKELLEQGLVVLWEFVQHQWQLVDNIQKLCQTLFKLRESHDAVILESTNALISLLVQISDPMLLLLELRTSLNHYLSEHPPPLPNVTSSITTTHSGLFLNTVRETPEVKIRNSGYLFGLTSIGMCVLRLSAPVVTSEGPKLGQIVMTAMQDSSSIIRQSAQSLLLAIQTILHSATRTLSFVPTLTTGQKDLAVYYMAQNGILEKNALSATEQENAEGNQERRQESMTVELARLMASSVVRE